MSLVYGPVPSRRLGMSLGIDPIPRLTCTFDCLYCQLGPKRRVVCGPEEVSEPFPSPEAITKAVRTAIEDHERIDYLTFSGSGEPTLNPRLAEAVEAVRTISTIPVVLITNASLLARPEVMAAAAQCDLVLPSLDAGDQETFAWIDRPAPGFDIRAIADAIAALARKTVTWLEVMLVASKTEQTNTHPELVGYLIEEIKRIRPHEVTLNTCVRPPAEKALQAVPEDKMVSIGERMKQALPGIPVVVVPKRTAARSKLLQEEALSEKILRTLQVRPCAQADLSDTLGLNPAEVKKCLARLLEEGRIGQRVQAGRLYYLEAKED